METAREDAGEIAHFAQSDCAVCARTIARFAHGRLRGLRTDDRAGRAGVRTGRARREAPPRDGWSPARKNQISKVTFASLPLPENLSLWISSTKQSTTDSPFSSGGAIPTARTRPFGSR